MCHLYICKRLTCEASVQAKSLKTSEETEYVLKKGGADIPVDACKGWFESCEYCHKRFCKWSSVDQEVYGKIPEKSGFFMIALKNKNTTEVVNITFDPSNIQKSAYAAMNTIKEQISDKKSKESKSEMLVRWMAVKNINDKENSILCAHWYNYEILPKYTKIWPGMNLLENGNNLIRSKQLQKWCYPQKNPVWRKAKLPSSKILEEVQKCNFQNCELCDSYFSPWKNPLEVHDSNLVPERNGIVMYSVVCGKSRVVVQIVGNPKDVVVNIRMQLKLGELGYNYLLKEDKFKNKNPRKEVRWMIMDDIDSDNSCFLFAHWLNSDTRPLYNTYFMIGKESLNKNKHFVVRESDKKWLYEIEALKRTKFSKMKHKRQIYDQMADDLDEEMF